MNKPSYFPHPLREGRREGEPRMHVAPGASWQTIWLLAVGIIGCAAPSGKISQTLSPKPLTEAARQVASARASDERRDDMQFELAEARWRRNELPVCQQMLEEVVARNPAHRLTNLRLAELYLSISQPRQALGLMQRFCRAHREDAEAHHLLGVSYEAMGQADRALAAYDVAASLDPDDPLVRTSLENAVAAREGGQGPALLPPQPSAADSPAATAEMSTAIDDEESPADLPPKREPRSLATAAAEQEPQRLDGQIAKEAGRSLKGPRIEIVTVPVATKPGPEPNDASEQAAITRAATGPSKNQPTADDSGVRGPADSDKSPVHWAYELEEGEAGRAMQKGPEKGTPGALPEASPEAPKDPSDGSKE